MDRDSALADHRWGIGCPQMILKFSMCYRGLLQFCKLRHRRNLLVPSCCHNHKLSYLGIFNFFNIAEQPSDFVCSGNFHLYSTFLITVGKSTMTNPTIGYLLTLTCMVSLGGSLQSLNSFYVLYYTEYFIIALYNFQRSIVFDDQHFDTQ